MVVASEYRNSGVGSMMVKHVLQHSDLKDVRHIALITADAQSFYAKHGFGPLPVPDRWMELKPSASVKP